MSRVYVYQTPPHHFLKRQRLFDCLNVKRFFIYGRKIAGSFQKIVCGTRRCATSACHFFKRYIVYFYAKYVCRTFQYLCDLTLDVIVKTECTTGESRTKGRAKHRNACCRGDECEGW